MEMKTAEIGFLALVPKEYVTNFRWEGILGRGQQKPKDYL